ncbi:MAG: YkgJ family cysteine cluster protein [Methanomicrobiales archaeon]|nr:YkgJ family cysteine cluster protein [Methanomicrobiales archaeon]
MNFGRYITVERRISPVEFICRFTLRSEIFSAKIVPEHIPLFSSRSRNPASASWCTFLREGTDGTAFVCTIFPHRPAHCRNYRCYTATISNRHGEIIGRVGNGKNLKSRDPALTALWEQEIRAVPAAEDQSWLAVVRQILADHDYRLESVDATELPVG